MFKNEHIKEWDLYEGILNQLVGVINKNKQIKI